MLPHNLRGRYENHSRHEDSGADFWHRPAYLDGDRFDTRERSVVISADLHPEEKVLDPV